MKFIGRYNSKDSYCAECFPWSLPLQGLSHVIYTTNLTKADHPGIGFLDRYADAERYYVDHGDDWQNTDANVVRGNIGQFLKNSVKVILKIDPLSAMECTSEDCQKYGINGFTCSGEGLSNLKANGIDIYADLDTILSDSDCEVITRYPIERQYILDLDVSNCVLHDLDLSTYKTQDTYIQGLCFSNFPDCTECRNKVIEAFNAFQQTTNDVNTELVPTSVFAPSIFDECKCKCYACSGCFHKTRDVLEWSIGCFYRKNVIVRYQNDQYESLQDHHAKALWTPDCAKSLWRKVV